MNRWDIVYLAVIIFCSIVAFLYLNSYVNAPKFTKEDCKIFENKQITIDIEEGYHFIPLDLKLCKFCNVEC